MINAYDDNQKVSLNGSEPVELNGDSVDRHADYAIDFIKQRADEDQPWYLWLCYSSPHSPQTPAQRHEGAYSGVSDSDIPISASFVSRMDKPNYVQKAARPKTNTVRSLVRRYHECIRSIDENVGRLPETLRQTGQLEDTVVIFTSDQRLAAGQQNRKPVRAVAPSAVAG